MPVAGRHPATASVAHGRFRVTLLPRHEIELRSSQRLVGVRLLAPAGGLHDVVADEVEQTAYFDARLSELLYEGAGERAVDAVNVIGGNLAILRGIGDQRPGVRLRRRREAAVGAARDDGAVH